MYLERFEVQLMTVYMKQMTTWLDVYPAFCASGRRIQTGNLLKQNKNTFNSEKGLETYGFHSLWSDEMVASFIVFLMDRHILITGVSCISI